MTEPGRPPGDCPRAQCEYWVQCTIPLYTLQTRAISAGADHVTNHGPETSCGHSARMRLISMSALSLTRGISSGSVYGQANARNYSRWFKAVIVHVRMFLVKCFHIQSELDIYFLMKSYVTFKQTVFELRLWWIDAHFKYCLLTKLGPFVLSLEFLKCLHLDKNVTPWKKESKIF